MSISTKKYPNRGFASMSPEQRRAIASMGGKTAHSRGVAHQWTRDEAVKAGSKGGRSTQRKRVTAKSAGLPPLTTLPYTYTPPTTQEGA